MNDDLRGPIISAISAFISVLVASALVPWIRGYFSRKQAARYLAIRCVCILDKYLEDCTEVACDWGRENREGYSEAQVSAPPAPSYPADIDWHSIDYALMYELLSLPAMAEKAASMVSNASEHAYGPDYGDYFETRSVQYSKLGLKAFELAQKLRSVYKISDRDFSDWNPVSRLKQELKEIEDRNARRAATHMPIPPLHPTRT